MFYIFYFSDQSTKPIYWYVLEILVEKKHTYELLTASGGPTSSEVSVILQNPINNNLSIVI